MQAIVIKTPGILISAAWFFAVGTGAVGLAAVPVLEAAVVNVEARLESEDNALDSEAEALEIYGSGSRGGGRRPRSRLRGSRLT